MIEPNWAVFGPLALTILINICAFAYVFGVTNQKLRNVDTDIERIRLDVERLHEESRDTDKRIHEMALMLTKISTQLDRLTNGQPITIEHPQCDILNCPFVKRDLSITGRRVIPDAGSERT